MERVTSDPLGFIGSLRGRRDLVPVYLGSRLVHAVTTPKQARAALAAGPRRAARRQLTQRQTATLVTQVAGWTVRLIGSWQDGQQVNVAEQMQRLTCRVMFGDVVEPELAEAVRNGCQSTVSLLMDRFFVDTVDKDRTLAAVLARRRDGADSRADLLSMLLSRMDDSEAWAELFTANVVCGALTWTWHELARQPEVQARLHAEVDAVLGGRPVAASDLDALTYTRRVVREVLRLHPVLLVALETTRSVRLAETELAAGSEVFLSPYALHRDPSLYADPERFDPDRWRVDRSAQLPRSSYLPFGVDDVSAFAWPKLTAAVAAVAARWQLMPVPGHQIRRRVGLVELPDQLPMVPVARGA